MKFRFIVLAAGKGTRMKQEIPKPLTPICGKPILQYLHETICSSGIDGVPVVVVGREHPRMCEVFGGACEYVIQEEQLGTAHAVLMCEESVRDADAVIVLYGDHPFVSAQTLKNLVQLHEQEKSVLTMITTSVPSFEGWHAAYWNWSRVLRDVKGDMIGCREFKDALDSEREIKEVNPCFFCFDAKWLWKNIGQIKNHNAKREYYLTDLVELAVTQGHQIASMKIPPEEAVGVNTQEERAIAESVLSHRHVAS